MFATIISFTQSHLLPLGAVGVFLASFFVELALPIFSVLLTLALGFLFMSGPVGGAALLRFLILVTIPAALGIVVGSMLIYGLAFFAGKPALEKWGKWFGLYWEDVLKLQAKFSKTSFDEWALIIVWSIPVIPSPIISAFCGIVRFPIRSYITFSLVGALVRSAILGFIGWQVGSLYFKYAEFFARFERYVLAAIILAAAAFIFWSLKRAKNRAQAKNLAAGQNEPVI